MGFLETENMYDYLGKFPTVLKEYETILPQGPASSLWVGRAVVTATVLIFFSNFCCGNTLTGLLKTRLA